MKSYSSKDPLVSFLYELLRDYVQPGNIETIMKSFTKLKAGDSTVFTNGYLANYAEDIAKRIRSYSSDDESDSVALTNALIKAKIKLKETEKEFHLVRENLIATQDTYGHLQSTNEKLKAELKKLQGHAESCQDGMSKACKVRDECMEELEERNNYIKFLEEKYNNTHNLFADFWQKVEAQLDANVLSGSMLRSIVKSHPVPENLDTIKKNLNPSQEYYELLPCPFCGAEASFVNDLDDRTSHEVACNDCQAYTWGRNNKDAAATWNTRINKQDDDWIFDVDLPSAEPFVPNNLSKENGNCIGKARETITQKKITKKDPESPFWRGARLAAQIADEMVEWKKGNIKRGKLRSVSDPNGKQYPQETCTECNGKGGEWRDAIAHTTDWIKCNCMLIARPSYVPNYSHWCWSEDGNGYRVAMWIDDNAVVNNKNVVYIFNQNDPDFPWTWPADKDLDNESLTESLFEDAVGLLKRASVR